MADSNRDTMKRLDRLEGAIGNIADILVDQSERIDQVSERIDQVSERVDQVSERVDRVHAEMVATRVAMTERLDRLITVTMSERTAGFERLAEIERRLARLESHVGL